MERQAILLNKIRELECDIMELDLEIESMIYLFKQYKNDSEFNDLLKKYYDEFSGCIAPTLSRENITRREILRLKVMKREQEIKLEKLETLPFRNGASKGIYEEAPESIIIL